MPQHLFGILAVVFLCMWKMEKTDANEYVKYIRPFSLYNDSDWYYNKISDTYSQKMLQNAQEYANRHPHNYVDRDSIIKQHMYISTMRHDSLRYYRENIRSFIMINFFLTIEAYDAAVNFRVCAFIYSKVIYNPLKFETCYKLSLYMEWYFSFMFEEKVEDFCNLKIYFVMKSNKPLTAEYVCKILRKLNLNFLKLPQENRSIDVLQYDENDVFNPNVLTAQNLETGERIFLSVFERYHVPSETEYKNQDKYVEAVYNEIWNLILNAYTDKFSELLSYFLEVIIGTPHQRNVRPRISNFKLMKTIMEYASMFNEITTLSAVNKRGVVSYTKEGNIISYIGSVNYRSNAVEILRQMSYYVILPTLTNAGLRVHNIMTYINSTKIKCLLVDAPENLSVDYCFEINENDIVPFLNLLTL